MTPFWKDHNIKIKQYISLTKFVLSRKPHKESEKVEQETMLKFYSIITYSLNKYVFRRSDIKRSITPAEIIEKSQLK